MFLEHTVYSAVYITGLKSAVEKRKLFERKENLICGPIAIIRAVN